MSGCKTEADKKAIHDFLTNVLGTILTLMKRF